MDQKQVEPLFGILGWLVQADPILPHLVMEPFIPHIAHPVHRQLRTTLLQQYRLDLDALLPSRFVVRGISRKILSAKVVDQARCGKQVERAEGSFLKGTMG